MENVEALFIKWWEKTGNKHIGNTFAKLRTAFYDGYRQGREDQNEADVKVVKGYTKEHPLSWQYTPSALVAAIRAPGPEVNDER
jgi:hypothetical protein